MAYHALLTLGGIELANGRRAAAYMEAGIKPPSMDLTDHTWQHTARFLGQQEYRLPALDLAPWYDPTEPDSKAFAGIWPMSVEGLDSATVHREVIDGLADGATFGNARFEPRAIHVEAILVGSTPAGVDYGLRWLSTTLRGQRCLAPMKGQALEYLSSVPFIATERQIVTEVQVPASDGLLPGGFSPGSQGPGISDSGGSYPVTETVPVVLSAAEFAACVNPYRRVLYEVFCTETPEVLERFGSVPDQPGSCAYRVKFTLTAGVPFAFRPPSLIASGVSWTAAVSPITWQIDGADPDACTTLAPDTLVDPTIPRSTVIRAADTYQLGTLVPLDSKTAVATIPRTALKPGQGDTALQVTVRAGAKEERLIRVRIGRKPAGATDTTAITCNLVSEASITYLPAGATITLDGVTGRSWATNAAGQTMDASPVVRGTNGAPWRPPLLSCDESYVVVADAPGDIAAAASFDVYGAVRET